MAESFLIRCTACKAKMRTSKREVIGRKIKCPKCEAIFMAKPLKAAASSASPSKAEKKPGPPKEPSRRVVPQENKSVESEPAVVSWKYGIGDDKKYHLAHISSEGVTLALKVKDYEKWVEVGAAAKSSPDEGASLLQELPKSVHFAPDDLARVTYADRLNQLVLFDQQGRRTNIPEGEGQSAMFDAIKQQYGGTETEEEADAWSIMKGPLVTLAIFGVIGGFGIWFTTICEPEYEATGRRAGMKTLLNWLGYTIGPMWSSVAVGVLCGLILVLMTFQLIKRPVRQVLELSN